MFKETDYAWLAGIMDGEGSFFAMLEKLPASRFTKNQMVTNISEMPVETREIAGG